MRTAGGSLVAQILGVSRWGGPLSAYYALTSGVEATHTKAMGRGNVLEASVLALWAEREGVFLVPAPRRLTAEAMPYAHATLDALALTALEDGDFIIPEAKTLAREHMGPEWGHDGSDRVAVEYHLQAVWYLGVARARGFDVVPEVQLPVLVGPDASLQWAARLVEAMGRPLRLADLEGTDLELRVYRIPWDEALFAAVDARVRAFIHEHVEPGVPPLPTEGDVLLERDIQAVARGTRATKGAALDFQVLAPVRQAVFTDLLEAVRQRREWGRKEEEAKARVQLAMGGAEEVRGLPGGARVTWKETKAGNRIFKVQEPRG